MAQTITISDANEETFEELVELSEQITGETNTETHVLKLMKAGGEKIQEKPYKPSSRHLDCLFALKTAINTRHRDEVQHTVENINEHDLLYACVVVALSSPDDVLKELQYCQ